MRERCDHCDRPVATQADFDACNDECTCERCRSLCWRNWNAGSCCNNQGVNWRARALAAESALESARAVIRRALDDDMRLCFITSPTLAAMQDVAKDTP